MADLQRLADRHLDGAPSLTAAQPVVVLAQDCFPEPDLSYRSACGYDPAP